MSTRAHIALRLRDEDRTKVFKTPWNEQVRGNKGNLMVYLHFGSVEDAAEDLVNMNMDYEQALKYILEGDRSTVDRSYWEWRQEQCAPEATACPDATGVSYCYYLEEISKGDPVVVRCLDWNDNEIEI